MLMVSQLDLDMVIANVTKINDKDLMITIVSFKPSNLLNIFLNPEQQAEFCNKNVADYYYCLLVDVG